MKNYINGKYCFKNAKLCTSSNGCFLDCQKGYIELLGAVKNNNRSLCLDEIMDMLFESAPEKVISDFQGQFIIVFYNKNTKELYIFHDRTSSPLPLFYCLYNECLYYSTSLKKLLEHCKIERKLNYSQIGFFTANGFCLGSGTLIERIYKLDLFHGLKVLYDSTVLLDVSYIPTNEINSQSAAEKWNKTLRHIILDSCDAETNEISIALSSGFDTNYILHVLNNENYSVNAFTVSGNSNNEIDDVIHIAQNRKIPLNYYCIKETDYICFPDVIWRIEGSVIECGIVLQYFLGKQLFDNKKNICICGECADEVMNPRYFSFSNSIYQSCNHSDKLSFNNDPYLLTNLMVKKKSYIMLNSFNIDARYPYVDDAFIPLSNALSHCNQEKKHFHKENCRQLFPKDIMEHIKSKGGATDFIDMVSADVFEYLLKTTKTINKVLFNRLIPDSVGYTVNGVEELMKYIYLLLFEKLFVSGKFDNVLSSDGIDIRFEDLFRKGL